MSNSRYGVKTLFIAFILCACICSCTSQRDSAPKSDATAIPDQPRDSVVIMLTAGDSTTAFDLLKASHNVDYQSSAAGVFVKAIDSLHGSSEAYWVYSVNDSMPQVAADKFTVRTGDVVRWHLRKVKQ